MRRSTRHFTLFALLLLTLAVGGVVAQDNNSDGGKSDAEGFPPTDVYVTTQDFVSFRRGPGSDFERITVIDPVITLPAYGRTADTRWIQVVFNEQYGWIAARFLVWSGDVTVLPVDGIDPDPFIRRANALAVTVRETPIYVEELVVFEQVGTLPAGTEVELTGRLGESGFFRFQILYEGELYWIGSWDVRVIDGDFRRLLDAAYLFPYGRLLLLFEQNLAIAIGGYEQISSIWFRLERGDSVRCSPIPPFVRALFTEADAQREPNFVPAAIALNSAITAINATIASFENACGNADVFLTPDDVEAALTELAEARRNLILASSLLEPLRARNPLLDVGGGG